MSDEYLYDMPAVAAQIRTAARQKNAIIKEMLAQCGLGINALSAMNHGKEISSGSLAKIADYLDVSVDYLLGRTDDPQAHKSPSVSFGNMSNNSGIVDNVGSTINSGTVSLDDHQKELIGLYSKLTTIQQAKLLVLVSDVADGKSDL